MADTDGWNQELAKWMLQTNDLLQMLPADYASCYANLAEVSQTFRERVAKSLQPQLNSHIATMPRDTLTQKSALATWLNHELHQLGLAIKCPRTQAAAILCADGRDEQDETGRFRLEVRGPSIRRSKTVTSAKLFDLELTPDVPRQEGRDKLTRQKEGESWAR